MVAEAPQISSYRSVIKRTRLPAARLVGITPRRHGTASTAVCYPDASRRSLQTMHAFHPPEPTAIVQGYEAALAKGPLLTKSVTSLAGFVVADAVAQLVSFENDANKTNNAWNFGRTMRVGLFGFFFFGPVSGAWYAFLDDTIMPDAPTSASAVALKTAADQLLWAPVLVSFLFAWDLAWSSDWSTSRTENGSAASNKGLLPQLQVKLKCDLLSTLIVNWTFWPAFHLVNFTLVPPGDRVLYVNIVQVFYNVFLCWQAAKRGGVSGSKKPVEGPASSSK